MWSGDKTGLDKNSPQGGIPVRLGNCAVLVEVGMVELDCTLPLGEEVALMLFVDDPDVNELGGVRGGL